MRDKELCDFIKKREAVRVAKEKGKKRPWTNDEILDTYRFCNVRRNDDRVTRELNDLAFNSVAGHEDEWFWWVVARLFNNRATMAAICAWVVPFDPERMRKHLIARTMVGKKNFNAAYIVSTNGRAMDKVDYVIDIILKPMWQDRKRLRPSPNDTLDIYHMNLMRHQGMGSFMAAQVVADMKYRQPLRLADDFLTWAASGPGSRRGLNRFLGRDPGAAWTEEKWREYFKALWYLVNGRLKWKEPLTGQDLQNCLCEWDKYERARLGEGRPKQIYKEKM